MVSTFQKYVLHPSSSHSFKVEVKGKTDHSFFCLQWYRHVWLSGKYFANNACLVCGLHLKKKKISQLLLQSIYQVVRSCQTVMWLRTREWQIAIRGTWRGRYCQDRPLHGKGSSRARQSELVMTLCHIMQLHCWKTEDTPLTAEVSKELLPTTVESNQE